MAKRELKYRIIRKLKHYRNQIILTCSSYYRFSKFVWRHYKNLKHKFNLGGIKSLAMNLDIITSNDDFLIINKAPQTLVHPTRYNEKNTLLNGVLWFLQTNNYPVSSVLPGPIHRLDRDTSGLVIFALNKTSKQSLNQIMQAKQFIKKYLVLVGGKIAPQGEITAPLIVQHQGRNYTIVDFVKGQMAHTKYELIKYFPKTDTSLVKVQIITGKSHQIRVHLRFIGHPVVGDSLYGYKPLNEQFTKEYNLTRQFLHAQEITFAVAEYNYAYFEAPLSNDLQLVLNNIA